MAVPRTEWEGAKVRLVALGALPGAPPTPTRGAVTGVAVHHTGGTLHRGLAGVEELLDHWTSPPAHAAHGVSGGGYGHRAPYHFVVPGVPDVGRGGLLEVYRLAPDLSQFTPEDRGCVHVGVCGKYTSRWGAPGRDQPDPLAWTALEELVCGYLLPRYSLHPSLVTGGYALGDTASPGDALEQWVRHTRGEGVGDPRIQFTPHARYRTDWPEGCDPSPWSPADIARALEARGYAPGPVGTQWTDGLARAVRAYQAARGLRPTGDLDVHTEGSLRAAPATV